MLKRSFEILTADFHSLSVFGAWQYGPPMTCSFTYEQSMTLPLSQKGNTILFEQLAKAMGISEELSDNTLTCFLYDVIFVDFKQLNDEESQILFLDDKNKAVMPMNWPQAQQWIYENGFSITGIPEKIRPDCKNEPGSDATVTIRYRPFVASASMAKKAQIPGSFRFA